MNNHRIKSYSNNFDSLRFLFACFVIITHSFPLTGNLESKEPLMQITNGQLSFSFIGLKGFFIISGYLIYQSFERSRTIISFLWKRVLRIFPAFILMSFIVTFILGLIASDLNVINYLKDHGTYFYFFDSINLFFHEYNSCLPGVFVSNSHGCEVNGSLWTISYEFLFYIAFIFIFFLKKYKLVLKGLFTGILLLLLFLQFKYINPYFKQEVYLLGSSIGIKALIDFGIYFIAGILLSLYKIEEIKKRNWLTLILLVIFLISLCLNVFRFLSPFVLSPIVIMLGLRKASFLPFLRKTGDLSYGIYLWAFPIQQTLAQYLNPSPFLMIILTTLICIPFAYMSWHKIEKPALELKSIFK